jgi:hypothetical protein
MLHNKVTEIVRLLWWAHTIRTYMKSSWIKIAIVGAAMLIGYGSYLITKTPDGPIEQAAEKVLQTQGIDIDLSPDE